MSRFFSLSLVALLAATTASAEPFETTGPLRAQTLHVTGSDTMFELFEAWSMAFTALHPEIAFKLSHEGSSTAPPALTEGRAELAPMSRPMTADEIATFKAAKGYAPTEVGVALDALAVFVNEQSPVRGLTMAELDGIFSEAQACGVPRIDSWSQLALGAPTSALHLHGRNDLSGTYATFRERALCGGDFRADLTEHEDTTSLIAAIAADPLAIGYAGVGYDTPEVRPVAIGTGDGSDSETRFFPFIVQRYAGSEDPALKYAWVVRGDYPLSRPLSIWIDRPESGEGNPAVAEFLRFTLSDEGQKIVEETGFVPLPADRIAPALAAFGQ